MKKFFPLLLLSATSLCADLSTHFEKVDDRAELEILSPTLAERKTAKLRLANGLEAYLVSDPGVEQSSAALAVEAGSWNDSPEYPGIAHFLEHMLFMGTKAYPKEDEFMPYCKENGGKVNAYTASDRTVYMFSVNNSAFEGALDRFSHFFIDPLFLTSSIERELLAVDQEHAKNIENDGWRQYMIFKETGNPHHPNAKFSTGNADTLRGIPQEAMKQWYKDHYSANKMHLVVLSSLPLDELIRLTTSDFSAVPENVTSHEFIQEMMTSDKQRGQMIYVKPVKDLKILSLTWELPPTLADDNEIKAGELLAYTLKSGSKNSLLGLLKRQHLASAISVSEEGFGKKNKLFSIDIELSDKGLEQVDQVISYCFESLARLRQTGVPRYIFDEVQKIAELKYQYQSRVDAFEFVMETAHKLVDEQLETFPKKTLIPTKYEPEFISNYIDYLTPETCVFFVMADPLKSSVPPTKEEKWMGAEYAIKPIAQKQLLSWSTASINPQIGLPPPNLYIPKNLELVHKTLSEEPVTPLLLEDNNEAKIFYSDDQKYLVPEIAYLFRLKSPHLDGSAKSKALSDLYLKALNDHLFPITSAAETAGARITFKQDNFSLAVAINGYSDQSGRLTEEIFSGIKKLRPSKEQFELYKQALASFYDNGSKELPVVQSMEILNSIVFSNAPTNAEKYIALQKITYNEFAEFSNQLFKKAYVEGLLYGNITKAEADTLWTNVKGKLKADTYPLSDQHKRRILLLPEGQGPYMVVHPTNMQGHAAILLIEQGPYNFEKRASHDVLGKVLQNAFFDTLRTKQQTAYIAKAWDKEEERRLVQFFAVQSSTHQPNELIARFELFIENFIKQYTTQFPKDRFDNVRKMAIASLQMPPENLLTMGTRLFILGFDYDADFHLIDKRIAALQKLTYEQTRLDAEAFLSRKNTRRIAVLVEGVAPSKDKDFRYELVSKDELQLQGTFVAWK